MNNVKSIVKRLCIFTCHDSFHTVPPLLTVETASKTSCLITLVWSLNRQCSSSKCAFLCIIVKSNWLWIEDLGERSADVVRIAVWSRWQATTGWGPVASREPQEAVSNPSMLCCIAVDKLPTIADSCCDSKGQRIHPRASKFLKSFAILFRKWGCAISACMQQENKSNLMI